MFQSTIRREMLGSEFDAKPGGLAAFRWVMPASVFENNPEYLWVINDGVSWIGNENEKNLTIICYPCRSKTLVNMVALHPDERDQNTECKYIFVLPTFLNCMADNVSRLQHGMSRHQLRRC